MISNINLLPWRAERRALQKRNFLLTLGFSALTGVLATAMIFTYFTAQISGQKGRNKFLEDKIVVGETKIKEVEELDDKKARLLGRKEVIDTLQLDRSRIVRLFEALVKSTPDGVMLTLVEQNEKGLTIEGRAQSSTRVSTYMRNLEASGWMNNPDLTVIEDAKDKGAGRAQGSKASVASNFPYTFKLTVGLTKPTEQDGVPGDVVLVPGPDAEAVDITGTNIAPTGVAPLVDASTVDASAASAGPASASTVVAPAPAVVAEPTPVAPTTDPAKAPRGTAPEAPAASTTPSTTPTPGTKP